MVVGTEDLMDGEDVRLKVGALFGLVLCALWCAFLAGADMAAAQAVTVGATSSTSDAPVYIADQKGYFYAEGLDVKEVNFRSAAGIGAPLGAGQMQPGRGAARAGAGGGKRRRGRAPVRRRDPAEPPDRGPALRRGVRVEAARRRRAVHARLHPCRSLL